MANEKSAESIAVAQQNEANLVNQYGQGMQNYINDQRTNGAVNTNASTLRGVWVDPQDISRTQQGYFNTAFVNEYKDPLLATVNPEGVYAATNIRSIDLPSPKKAMDMKLQGLEQKLAKANSIAELNQIGIMNQPKAMGVLTGEAAYREKLDTARLNAFNNLYQARMADEQRKEAKKQQFIQTYGADPSQRPKGMSTKQFAAALTAGKFSNLLTSEEKLRRASIAAKTSGGAGTLTERLGKAASDAYVALQSSVGTDGKVNPGVYKAQKLAFMSRGGTAQDFDANFANMLSPQEQKNLGISSTVGMSQGQVNTLNSIINQYKKNPLIAASDRTTVLKNTIEQIKRDPSNSAQQLNLAYSYIQALDTYQSAVREGELSLVNSIDSKVGQISNYIEQINNGRIVRPEVALQIAEAAGTIVDTINSAAKQQEQSYKAQAYAEGVGRSWEEYTAGFTPIYNNQTISGTTQPATSSAFTADKQQFLEQQGLAPATSQNKPGLGTRIYNWLFNQQ